jgi:plastocyanin domain-containing protein
VQKRFRFWRKKTTFCPSHEIVISDCHNASNQPLNQKKWWLYDL